MAYSDNRELQLEVPNDIIYGRWLEEGSTIISRGKF